MSSPRPSKFIEGLPSTPSQPLHSPSDRNAPLFQILHEMDDYERKRSSSSSSGSSSSSNSSTSFPSFSLHSRSPQTPSPPQFPPRQNPSPYTYTTSSQASPRMPTHKYGSSPSQDKSCSPRNSWALRESLDMNRGYGHGRTRSRGSSTMDFGAVQGMIGEKKEEVEALGLKLKGRLRAWSGKGNRDSTGFLRVKAYEGT